MSRVAIFGGTFNPIHNGHMLCARECLKQIGCDKIIFVPSNIPPHKTIKTNKVTTLDRFEMCKLAIRENDKIELSDFELKNDCVSYTVNTLKYFSQKISNVQLYLIVGQDMFDSLMEWKEPESIFKMADVCVAQRYNGNSAKDLNYIKKLEHVGARIKFLDLIPFEVSSTFIREQIKSGKEVSQYLPQGVEDYIIKNNLYN